MTGAVRAGGSRHQWLSARSPLPQLVVPLRVSCRLFPHVSQAAKSHHPQVQVWEWDTGGARLLGLVGLVETTVWFAHKSYLGEAALLKRAR